MSDAHAARAPQLGAIPRRAWVRLPPRVSAAIGRRVAQARHRALPNQTCMDHAAFLARWYAATGVAATTYYGVRAEDGGVKGHCWTAPSDAPVPTTWTVIHAE